ncbi:hypothetical protein ARMGADRAFT_547747 [Armillaria gallica]|uniref:Uncharacterized protein n=1 Tax=Armillaria gallica TaxID=47427 RepID=A0A2H3DBH4_ARMGA|nr:hypothetical protein ARMGADRAFT_547747 [Armillaria gallica]
MFKLGVPEVSEITESPTISAEVADTTSSTYVVPISTGSTCSISARALLRNILVWSIKQNTMRCRDYQLHSLLRFHYF